LAIVLEVLDEQLTVLVARVSGRVIESDHRAVVRGQRVEKHQAAQAVAGHVNTSATAIECGTLKKYCPAAYGMESSFTSLEIDIFEVHLLVRVSDSNSSANDVLACALTWFCLQANRTYLQHRSQQ
jgi:hypothetical protein